MKEVHFNPETHIYEAGGKIIPSVTQILKSVGIIVTKYHTEVSKIRGQAVHLAIEYWLEQRLDINSIDPLILPYFEAFLCFERDSKYIARYTEMPMYHPVLNYAGKPDIVASLNNKQVLLDIKTGQVQAWHSLQVAGYAMLCERNGIEIEKAYFLYLKKTGKYSLIECGDLQSAKKTFSACYEIYKWKQNGRNF